MEQDKGYADGAKTMLAQALRPHGYAQYRARLSELLSIAADANELQVQAAVTQGFPATLLMALSECGEIAPEERDQVIALEALQARLGARQPLSPEESERLFRIAHVRAMAETIFGDKDKARRWLSKPKSRFDGASPVSLLTSRQGCLAVEELLVQVAEGYAF